MTVWHVVEKCSLWTWLYDMWRSVHCEHDCICCGKVFSVNMTGMLWRSVHCEHDWRVVEKCSLWTWLTCCGEVFTVNMTGMLWRSVHCEHDWRVVEKCSLWTWLACCGEVFTVNMTGMLWRSVHCEHDWRVVEKCSLWTWLACCGEMFTVNMTDMLWRSVHCEHGCGMLWRSVHCEHGCGALWRSDQCEQHSGTCGEMLNVRITLWHDVEKFCVDWARSECEQGCITSLATGWLPLQVVTALGVVVCLLWVTAPNVSGSASGFQIFFYIYNQFVVEFFIWIFFFFLSDVHVGWKVHGLFFCCFSLMGIVKSSITHINYEEKRKCTFFTYSWNSFHKRQICVNVKARRTMSVWLF